jgi:hypothetical protein
MIIRRVGVAGLLFFTDRGISITPANGSSGTIERTRVAGRIRPGSL